VVPSYFFFTSIYSISTLSMNTLTAIFLDLLSNGELHGNLLRLGGLVLGDDDEAGLECRRLQPSASVCHALQSQLSQCTLSRRSS
jgi:hypothetical protein